MRRRTRLFDRGLGVLAVCMCMVVAAGESRGQPRPGGGFQPPLPKPPVFQPLVMPPLPKPPVMPRPPIIVHPRPHQFVNNGQTEWFCSRCKHVLSHGPNEPVHITICPACNARFTDGALNNLPMQPGGGGLNPGVNLPAVHNRGVEDPSPLFHSAGFWIVLALAALALLAIIGAIIAFLISRGSNAPTTRKSRSRRFRDD